MTKILFYIDSVSNSVDNDLQRSVMDKLALNISKDHTVEIVDTAIYGKEKSHLKLLNQNYDILFTYNRTGTEITLPGNSSDEFLLKKIDKLHVCWLTEHPVTFFSNYLQSENKRHYIFPNERHSFFSDSMGLMGSFSSCLFGSDPTKVIKNHFERKYEVCIAAQWRGSEDANAFWKNSEGKIKQFFESILELQESDENRDTFVAYLAAAQYFKIDMSDKIWHANAMKSIYWYARKKERINLVKDTVASGMKIVLIGGEAWKSVLPKSNNVTFIDECNHESLRAIYGDSKSVININASNGACERAFDSLSAGAMLISEESTQMEKLFGYDNSAILFKPNHAHSKMGQIKEIIRSGQSTDIALKGTSKFLAKHTWQDRSLYLSNIFSELLQQHTA